MTDTYDPEKYADELEAAGVPKQQASIHARHLRAMANYVIVRIDRAVEILTSRINVLQTTLESEIAITKAELGAKVDMLRSDFNGFRDDSRAKFACMDKRFTRLEIGLCVSLFMSAANLALVLRLSYP